MMYIKCSADKEMEKTMEYDALVLETFLKNQTKLFDETVAETMEEAEVFLSDCMAQVFENIKEVRSYWEEEGVDMEAVSDEELKEELEVFAIPDGRYLVVEA